MKMRAFIAAVAVSTLALAQPAAAATRSFESLPKSGVEAAPAERVASITDQAEANGGALPIWLIILIFGSVAAFIALITGDKSPG